MRLAFCARAILFTMLAALLLPRPAVAQTVEDVVEFPYVMYRSTAYAPDPRTGCTADPKTERVYVPCEPDPYNEICHAIGKDTIDAAKREDQKIADVQKQSWQAQARGAREARKKLGPEPAYGSAEYGPYARKFGNLAHELATRYYEPVREKLKTDLEADRPKVESMVATVRDTMLKLIDASPRFSKERSLMKGFINCAKTVKLDVDNGRTNARMAFSFWPDPRSDWATQSAANTGHDVKLVADRTAAETRESDGDAVVINPLEVDGPGASGGTCFLTLSTKAWIACADGEYSCLREMFHEFGHLFNSCAYIESAHRARVTLAEEYAAPDTDDQERGATAIRFLARQSTAFANKLIDATSCLAGLSDTRDGVLNACKKDPTYTEAELARCREDATATGYPSQWNEAEADFWGASGVALWLKDSFKTQDERAAAFYKMFAYTCASDVLEGMRINPDAFRTANRPIEAPTHSKDCVDIPSRRPPAKAWGLAHDPGGHEPWSDRANRNFMRNADLRDALGCPKSDPRIPFTCSPIR